jgi:hypothetical protein
MDQQALLASLVQLNSGLAANLAPIQAHPRHSMPPAGGGGLAASPCFSMPGLTLQGFNGMPAHNAGLLPNAPLQTLLSSNAANQPSMVLAPTP